MLRLHGFPVSNYYNMVKTVLLEKGIPFEAVDTRPSQTPEYLARSPMGKVPCLETPEGFLTETSVIMEYLEDLGQGPSLLPENPFARAQVRELIHYLELYIELSARRLYGDAFFGRPADEALKADVRTQLTKGLAAYARLDKGGQYTYGDSLTLADVFYYFTMTAMTRMAKLSLGWDAYKEVPGVRSRLEFLGSLPSIAQVNADRQRASS